MSGAFDIRKMKKIDAHHHLWDVETNSYPWLTHYPKSTHPRVMYDTSVIGKMNFTLDAYRKLSKPENVVKSVFIQAGMADPVTETRWVQKLSDDSGFPIMIVPYLDMTDPFWEKTIEAHLESPNVRAMRHIIADSNDPDGHVPPAFNNYVWQANYAKLAKYNMGFDMHVFPWQMDKAINIIGRSPDVPNAICHTGEPYDQSPDSVELWRKGMAGLAALDNTVVKISGFGMFMHHWTVENAARFVRETIELFGPDRCMFASNVPPDMVSGTYERIYSAFYDWTAEYSEDEQKKLFYENAEKYYKF
jgi:predicted TIM-barrel fold metal-dependent hydrolase